MFILTFEGPRPMSAQSLRLAFVPFERCVAPTEPTAILFRLSQTYPSVAIVNSELVRKYLPDVDPLTQRVSVVEIIPGVPKLGPLISWQIVGVYEDVRS